MEKRINCFRTFALDVAGRKKIVSVPGDMTKERMDRCLVACRAYLCQCVYVEIVLAECFMQAVEASVQNKRCFKFEIKKRWAECKRNLGAIIKRYDEFSPNGGDYNEEFAITFYENTSESLYNLRDKIAVRLQRLGCGAMSGMYANSIILYNLTSMCISTYEAIVNRLYEKLRVNLMDAFRDFCPISAFEHSFKFMALVMGKDFERLSGKAVSKDLIPFFDKVRNNIFDNRILDEAAKNASEILDDEHKELHRSFVKVEDFMAGTLDPKLPAAKEIV